MKRESMPLSISSVSWALPFMLFRHLGHTCVNLYSRRQVKNNFSDVRSLALPVQEFKRTNLDVRLARSTNKVAIYTVEDIHWRRHLLKTHLNPKIRRKTFRLLPDIQARWSWLPPGPFACSSWTPSRWTPPLEAAPWCQGSMLEQICGCHPWGRTRMLNVLQFSCDYSYS